MKWALLIFISIFTTFVHSQDITYSGEVVDDYGNPLAGIIVMEPQLNKGVQTNATGGFSLTLPKGKHSIVIKGLSNEMIIDIEGQEDQYVKLVFKESPIALGEVLVSSVRVSMDAPIAHSNINKEEINMRNLGQDIPTLLNFLPSVVTTSDAGAGIGYTGIRIRGSDATRINVTINGIPYNDAESHATYWVDLPDFASSLENIQIQRGVGTSVNGVGAFGASINLLTNRVAEEAYGELSGSLGSFNTKRITSNFSTGKSGKGLEFSGRLSYIGSDGYVDRASADLKSYFLQLNYETENSLLKALAFGGREITYQSWYGVDAMTLKQNRTFNPAGPIYDELGTFQKFYENQIDNYKQDHYQLHWYNRWNSKWSLHFGLNYTYGQGYFEEYVDEWYYREILFAPDATYTFLGLQPMSGPSDTIINESDNVRRKWLDNDFYVAIMSINYKTNKAEYLLGGSLSHYKGDQFGELIWVRYASDSEPFDRIYENSGKKTDWNTFFKFTYHLTPKFETYLDVQLRGIDYKASGTVAGPLDLSIKDHLLFFNPKGGLSYSWNLNNQLYFSFSRAHREPNRVDYENGSPKPEQLNDFELGWRFYNKSIRWNANVYFMRYKDQLVLTGALDDVGNPIRANVGDSYRLGLELDSYWAFHPKWLWNVNLALSQNENLDFNEQIDGKLVNLGSTAISFSPSVVMGSSLRYALRKHLHITWLSKYVGRQYLSNNESSSAILPSYWVNDLNIVWSWPLTKVFDFLELKLLLNNFFNRQYESNGYYYTFDFEDGTGNIITEEAAGYYPQAGINYLLGLTLKF